MLNTLRVALRTSVLVAGGAGILTAGCVADGTSASSEAQVAFEAATDNWQALPSYSSNNFTVTPWADSNETAFSHCPVGTNASNRPVALWFGGGDGTLAYNGVDLTGLAGTVAPFRTALRTACVRLVVMLTTSGYFANAPAAASTYASGRKRLDVATRDVRVVINKALATYGGVTKYWFLGGSMSSMIGAKLVETNEDTSATDPDGSVPSTSRAATALRGVFLAGPPIDSLAKLCDAEHNNASPHVNTTSNPLGVFALTTVTGTSSCTTLRTLSGSDPGTMFDAAKMKLAILHHPISLYVGEKDEIWSGSQSASPPAPYWTAVQGTTNFTTDTGFLSSQIVNGVSKPSLGTMEIVSGATHTTTWTTAVLNGIAAKMRTQQ